MDAIEVSKSAGATIKTVKARVDAKVQSAVDQAMTRVGLEKAEPEGWWNLWAVGPIQEIKAGGPLLPHSVIKIGEKAYVYTVIWLNPTRTLNGGPTVCNMVTNLGCSFRIKYCTGNVCTWTPAAGLSTDHEVKMEPGKCWYVDVLEFTAKDEGCYEMHICVNVKGCTEGAAPALAGFATAVADIDADLFYPAWPTVPPPEVRQPPGVPPHEVPGWRDVPYGHSPRWEYDIPIRFMIYP
jgi:hypothetical protein